MPPVDMMQLAEAVKQRAYRNPLFAVYKQGQPRPSGQAQPIPFQREQQPEGYQTRPESLIPLSRPELRPDQVSQDVLTRFQTRPHPSDEFASYTRQTKATTQSGKSATESLIRILEAQRVEAARLAAERLAGAGRSPTGEITSAYGGRAPSNPSGNVRLGQQIAARHGIVGREWDALHTLGMKESGWRSNAQNPTSTAFGIGQFLDKTWRTVGGQKTTSPSLQIEYMIRYINQRYGSPSRALSFHLANNWY